MAEEMEVGCARPTGGPVGESIEKESEIEPTATKEVSAMIQVGKKSTGFYCTRISARQIYIA